jgi:hypothetical protein
LLVVGGGDDNWEFIDYHFVPFGHPVLVVFYFLAVDANDYISFAFRAAIPLDLTFCSIRSIFLNFFMSFFSLLSSLTF